MLNLRSVANGVDILDLSLVEAFVKNAWGEGCHG